MTAPEPSASARRRNARGQGGILRGELIEAAARLLAETEQPESLTLRQIAREVGVAPASIYGHFADLGVLIDHVLELRYAELSALMAEADRETTPLARLVRRVETFIHWGLHHPGEYRTLFGGRMPVGLTPSHHAGMDLLDAMTTALTSVTVTTARDGQSTSADQQRAGLLLWTGMHGLIDARTAHPNVPWPPLADLIAQLVVLHTRAPASKIQALVIHSEGDQVVDNEPDERD